MNRSALAALAGAALAGAARAALGLLWLAEGVTKLRAGFGRADILLVAEGAQAGGSRSPEVFQIFAGQLLAGAPELFGLLVPFAEVSLGLCLLLGVFRVPAAAVSILLLSSYWMADQLIDAYPVMLLLAAAVLLFPVASGRFSLGRMLARKRSGKEEQAVGGREPLLRRLL